MHCRANVRARMYTRKGICPSMRSSRQRMRAPSSELQVACATVSVERSVDVCRGVRVAPCRHGALWRHVCAVNSKWRNEVKIVSQLVILGSVRRQPPSHCAAKAKPRLASKQAPQTLNPHGRFLNPLSESSFLRIQASLRVARGPPDAQNE